MPEPEILHKEVLEEELLPQLWSPQSQNLQWWTHPDVNRQDQIDGASCDDDEFGPESIARLVGEVRED